MERLTESNPTWIDDELWESACEPDCEEIDAVYRKLKEYEDLEEQGRLLKLPCKDGDIIYSVVEDGLTIVELRFSLGFYARRGSDIGKTVFLTKSEAEAKLKELGGGEDE